MYGQVVVSTVIEMVSHLELTGGNQVHQCSVGWGFNLHRQFFCGTLAISADIGGNE